MGEHQSKNYAYVRVSSKDQNTMRQILAMKEQGISAANTYVDMQSGKDFQRDAYQRLLKKLKENDVLTIQSIDRLGRNYTEILEQWRIITKDIKADIRVLDMPLLNTTLSKDLIGTFIADLVLQVLSFVAENERGKIHERQQDGIAAARKRGVKFGRPRLTGPNIDKAVKLYHRRQISLQDAITLSEVSRSTFYDRLKEYRKNA